MTTISKRSLFLAGGAALLAAVLPVAARAQAQPVRMQPEIGYVPSGVVEVMKKQQQGWAYIRS